MILTYRIKSKTDKGTVPPNFERINVLSWLPKDSKYYTLSPYFLKTDGHEENYNTGGCIFENFWQFSKVYPHVYFAPQYPGPFQQGKAEYLVWQYPDEDHVINGNIYWDRYYRWRYSGFLNDKPVRRPNGKHQRECLGHLLIKSNFEYELLDYVTARKRLYEQEYVRLVRQTKEYSQLLNKLKQGQNICIHEIDVPSPSKKGYYGSLCDSQGYFVATLQNIDLLVKDTSEAFGHGLVLAKALLEDLQ